MPEALQNALDSWSIFLGVGVGELRKNRKKNRNFKIDAEFGGLCWKMSGVLAQGWQML